jgi:hypothetical protein
MDGPILLIGVFGIVSPECRATRAQVSEGSRKSSGCICKPSTGPPPSPRFTALEDALFAAAALV